jgi:TonB family protein
MQNFAITCGRTFVCLPALMVCVTLHASTSFDEEGRRLVKNAQEILDKHPDNGLARSEKLLRNAIDVWQDNPPANPDSYAEACTILSLVLLAGGTPPATVRPLAEKAVRLYEQASPPVDDERLALAIEALAATYVIAGERAAADTLRSRSGEIRKRIIEQAEAQREAGMSPLPELRKAGRDGMTVPKLRSKEEPRYSTAARVMKLHGAVLFSLVIDRDGKVRNIRIVRGIGFGLDEAAYDAIKRWKFKPSTLEGQPIAVTANTEVNFRIR